MADQAVVRCGCGCEFQVRRSELGYNPGSLRYYEKCPECRSEFSLYDEDFKTPQQLIT